MSISVGDRIPAASLKQVGPEGTQDVSTPDFFAGRKIVLFGVPGAFTPTCSNNHLPGFAENSEAMQSRGADEVAVVAVNDHFVMQAWAGFTGAQDRLTFLADGNGEFTRALGLEADLSGGGLGCRSKRYSMIVEDGTITAVNVEDNPGEAEASSAARILEQL